MYDPQAITEQDIAICKRVLEAYIDGSLAIDLQHELDEPIIDAFTAFDNRVDPWPIIPDYES